MLQWFGGLYVVHLVQVQDNEGQKSSIDSRDAMALARKNLSEDKSLLPVYKKMLRFGARVRSTLPSMLTNSNPSSVARSRHEQRGRDGTQRWPCDVSTRHPSDGSMVWMRGREGKM